MSIGVTNKPLPGMMSCGHDDTAQTRSFSARKTIRSPGLLVGSVDLHAAIGGHRAVLEQVERLRHVHRQHAVMAQAFVHVVQAVAMTIDAEIDAEARAITGRDIGVVYADGVVQHFQQRLIGVRVQAVADAEEQRVETSAGCGSGTGIDRADR